MIPGGVSSPVRAYGSVGGTPPFLASARGAYVTDVEGREYVDLVGSWGPALLGHAHPEVVAMLLDEERGPLEAVEQISGKKINLQPVPEFHVEQFELVGRGAGRG